MAWPQLRRLLRLRLPGSLEATREDAAAAILHVGGVVKDFVEFADRQLKRFELFQYDRVEHGVAWLSGIRLVGKLFLGQPVSRSPHEVPQVEPVDVAEIREQVDVGELHLPVLDLAEKRVPNPAVRQGLDSSQGEAEPSACLFEVEPEFGLSTSRGHASDPRRSAHPGKRPASIRSHLRVPMLHWSCNVLPLACEVD